MYRTGQILCSIEALYFHILAVFTNVSYDVTVGLVEGYMPFLQWI